MKKMIYAVKNGRKTGIFNEWLKCSEQTNRYPNSKFRRFEYRSELEHEAEDVPGSLRHAIKEAEEYLENLVYLGESADYLEDAGWEEDGFLPFGDAAKAADPELFSQEREQEEEDARDFDEALGKWMAGNRNIPGVPTGYWKMAEDMLQYVRIIKEGDPTAKEAAAGKLRKRLLKCLSDVNLDRLTAIYRDQAEQNALGYDVSAVQTFVTRMAHTYPRPEPEEIQEAEDDISIRQIFMETEAIETELKQRIAGQDAVIERLSEAYFNAELKACLTPDRRGPKGAYLLAGPPGVGKTFMAQLFAFKLGIPFQRFDMSGYSGKEALQELVGFAPTWKDSEPGLLTEYVLKYQKCVLLFDEIEKAHITVIRMFLQILDDGVCEDKYHQRDVSFQNVIIFFTTNAGRQLYRDAQNENLTLLPDKVVLDALEKDQDPETKQPFFPPEILSRMSSHTVIMLNHLRANAILELVKDDIDARFKKIRKKYRYDLRQGKEYLARTVLYSIGGSADARNASKIAGKLVDRELHKLLGLLEEKQILDENGEERRIEWKCDFEDATEEIRDFYFGERECVIPVFGTVKYEPAGRLKHNHVHVKHTVDLKEYMEMIHKEHVLFAVIDYLYGLEHAGNGLSALDAASKGREAFFKLREENKEIPVYILDGSCGHDYTEKEKNALIQKGAGGFLERKYFRLQLEQTYLNVCCQEVMETLTARHQVLTYETRQEFDEKTNAGSIIFCNFKLETAVESEDRALVLSENLRPHKSWDDICVSEYLKKELGTVIEYLRAPKGYHKRGVRPKGVLLYGPPGSGKTLLAEVVASESGVSFLSVSASELFQGGSGKVQDVFRIARKYAPAILFIDEIDAIGMKREYSNVPNPVLNALLIEMDGFKRIDNKPVFIMAATNHGSKIDSALLRRFDMRFVMDFLDQKGNLRLLEKLMEKQGDMFEIPGKRLESIAKRSVGLSPSLLKQVVEAALREGIRSGCRVDGDLFDEIFERRTQGEERVDRSPKQIERTAYHEAGHALIDLYYGRPPIYMTIVARGDHGGYVRRGTENRDSTRKYYLEKICSALGGRAAETVFADVLNIEGGPTHGACGDLKTATGIAADMVRAYGMYEEEFGLAVVEDPKLPHDEKAIALINRILSEQLKEATRIIEQNRAAMERLVKAVIHQNDGKKYLTGEEIQEAAGELNKN